MLDEFITLHRAEIIARCRAKVAARSIPPPTADEIDHGVPLFLDQLVDALRSGQSGSSAIDRSAGQHGQELRLKGFTLAQVVHDYGDVCQTITGLAVETDVPISSEDFRLLNRCLDDAIASAVTTYASDRDQLMSREATQRSNQRVGFLVHELRNLVNTAIVAFEVLKTGSVGVTGSTGAVLNRSLLGLRDLIAHSLDDVRMANNAPHRQPLLLSAFIEEVRNAASLEASVRGVTLVVSPVAEGLTIDADRQILAAVLSNLLQNAFKFTRPNSTVTLTVKSSDERVLLEVHDECGGLPGTGATNELAPTFDQRGTDRSGLGIGLVFSRWGAEVNGGRLYARNLPGTGCVFTIDLPRSVAVPTPA